MPKPIAAAPRRQSAVLAGAALTGLVCVAGGAAGVTKALDPDASRTEVIRALDAVPPAGLPNFADVVEKVKPAVIGIRATVEASDRSPSRLRRPPRDQDLQPGLDDREVRRPAISAGSGFFISADGYALTSHHVIENAKEIKVTTDGAKDYPAKLVGSDPATDLALLKVEATDEVPFVQLADHTPRTGEWVFAIGNPFGLGTTVTAGIISATSRDIRLGAPNDFLQIDAPLNQGNSGGPTFDLNGAVVGINSAIFSPTGASVGIGFAIPAETAKAVAAQLKDKGSAAHGWMGIRVQTLTPDIAAGLGLEQNQNKGALVIQPEQGSPAASAGIVPGDVVVSLNDDPVKDARDLTRRVGNMTPGTSIKLGILRRGTTQTITLALGNKPALGARLPKSDDRK
jgi:serine protease Do